MNRPPEECRCLDADQLQAFSAACFQAAGLRADHADLMSSLLTQSDLRGVRSHGNRAMPRYCRSLEEGQTNPDPDIRVLMETDAAILVGGDGGFGYATMMKATDAAIGKAKERGVAVGASCHHGHYGSAGHYVRRAMEADARRFPCRATTRASSVKAAAILANKPPTGATRQSASACPGRPAPPIILDAETCILADYQRGPEFDALQSLIPAAFFKSMGYTGIATALGGCFLIQNDDAARAVTERWPLPSRGALSLS